MKVYGNPIDDQTRCRHYQSQLDIIALKCYSCRRYYPCYLCHDSCESHSYQAYPLSLAEDKAVFCGACQQELTISQYRKGAYSCPYCGAAFNPGCQKHSDIYFEKIAVKPDSKRKEDGNR